jgi:hypothetical protein
MDQSIMYTIAREVIVFISGVPCEDFLHQHLGAPAQRKYVCCAELQQYAARAPDICI